MASTSGSPGRDRVGRAGPSDDRPLRFSDFLKYLWVECVPEGVSQDEVAGRAELDSGYITNLHEGIKDNPSRDAVIRLGYGMTLSLNQIDKLLFVAGYAPITNQRLSWDDLVDEYQEWSRWRARTSSVESPQAARPRGRSSSRSS